MVHSTNLSLKVVSFLAQATLQISCLLQLHLKLAAGIVQFSLQILDLTIFTTLNQRKFVSGSLDLPEEFGLLFIPSLNLRLKYFNLVLEVVHVNFHFMFKLYGAKHKNINKHLTMQASKMTAHQDPKVRNSYLKSQLGIKLTLIWPRTSDSSFWINFSYLLGGPRM